MRCSRRALLTCVLTASLLAACDARDENRASKEARHQFHAVMEGKLRQLDRGIAALAYAAEDSAHIAALRKQQRTLQGQLHEMANASDQRWMSLKESMETEYRDLREQYAAIDRTTSDTSARMEPDTMGTSGGMQTN